MYMDSEKDRKVKRIARFLELGGTMLAEHCNECGAPRFRYQGKVICPICDVRDEEEVTKPATEIQFSEAKKYTEKDKLSIENKKRVSAHRQKPSFELRTDEATEEEEKAIEFVKEDFSKIPYDTGETKKTATILQGASPKKAEKPTWTSKLSVVDENKEVLKSLLFKKIVSIAISLQDETAPQSIAEDFELIEKCLGIIERLKKA
jgi:UPF0148 protein